MMCSITTYSDRWVMDSYMYIIERVFSYEIMETLLLLSMEQEPQVEETLTNYCSS